MKQLPTVVGLLLIFCSMLLPACAGDDANDCGGEGGSSVAGQSGANAAGMGGAGGQAGVGAGGTGMAGQSGSGAAGTGEMLCGGLGCEVGQHCFNGICVNGCLSDANCAGNQSCQDIDNFTNVGTCRNNPVMPVKDCNAFCDKAFACQDPMAAFCMMQCQGLSAACVVCVVDSNCGAGCDAQCAF